MAFADEYGHPDVMAKKCGIYTFYVRTEPKARSATTEVGQLQHLANLVAPSRADLAERRGLQLQRMSCLHKCRRLTYAIEIPLSQSFHYRRWPAAEDGEGTAGAESKLPHLPQEEGEWDDSFTRDSPCLTRSDRM